MEKSESTQDSVKRERPPFTILEDTLLDDPRLSAHDQTVYMALCYFEGKETPSQDSIAEIARCSQEELIEGIRYIAELGYIHEEAREELGVIK